jgi:hypothetical protein
MAKQDKDHPDGPGGTPVPPTDKHAFDADGRADAREGAPITIGGKTFHRRRKNWSVTRALRALLRLQEKAGNKSERLRAQIDAHTEKIRGVRDPKNPGEWLKAPLDDDAEVEKIEGQVEDLQAKVDVAQDEGEEAAFQMIALLLKDDDGVPLWSEKPEESKTPAELDLEGEYRQHLKDSLDSEDAADLATSLAGGKVEDPTPETTSS